MTVQSLPWAIQGQSHPADVARSQAAAMLGVPVAAHAVGFSVTTAGGGHGVVLPDDLLVAQNGTPNMSVNVAAGRAMIRAGHTGNLLSGCYSLANDATVNLAVTAAHATLARKDMVIAQVRDANYGEAASDARLLVVAGTPAASPADPDLTAYPNCVVLARISVAAAASSITNANITDLRTWVSAIGGRRRVHSTYRPTGASLYAGLEIFEHDTGRNLQYDGTAWRGQKTTSATATGIAGTTSAATPLTVCTLTFSDPGCAGKLHLVGRLRFDNSAAGDRFEVALNSGGVIDSDYVACPTAGVTNSGGPAARVSVAGGSATTVTMVLTRTAGTGTATVYAASAFNHIDATFVPD